MVGCPLDIWIYQEILFRPKPDIIIETGVHCGGSTLYLASICDLLGTGRVLACLPVILRYVDPKVAAHPRAKLFEGSSVDPEIVRSISDISKNKRTMVILDCDHSEPHVYQELKMYSPLVRVGCYLICEDTNVNGHPVFKTHGPGPYEAVKRFLYNNDSWQVDHDCERLLLTFNPNGYLLRTK